MKSQFMINSLSPPVQSAILKVASSSGMEIHSDSEISSVEIDNFFDEIVGNKKDKVFNFTWNPSEKLVSTFVSRKDSKSKEKPKKFVLSLIARLTQDGKLVWSRQVDFKDAWVIDATPHPSGAKFVSLGYGSAALSKAVHH